MATTNIRTPAAQDLDNVVLNDGNRILVLDKPTGQTTVEGVPNAEKLTLKADAVGFWPFLSEDVSGNSRDMSRTHGTGNPPVPLYERLPGSQTFVPSMYNVDGLCPKIDTITPFCTGDFSISLWFRRFIDSSGSGMKLVTVGGTGDTTGFALASQSGKMLVQKVVANAATADLHTSDAATTNSAVTHIVYVRKHSNRNYLFINGVIAASGFGALTNTGDANAKLVVGGNIGDQNLTYRHQGPVWMMGIWPRPLTFTETGSVGDTVDGEPKYLYGAGTPVNPFSA